MALTKPHPKGIDALTAQQIEAAQQAVASDISEQKQRGINIYYREYRGGPLIQELPDGTKRIVAPPVRNG